MAVCGHYTWPEAEQVLLQLMGPNHAVPSSVEVKCTCVSSGGFRGGKGGCKCTPLWQLVMYFCVRTCTSPSNDYTAVAWRNNNQAQLHTCISSLLISRCLARPRVAIWTASVTGSGRGNPKNFRTRTPLSKFLNLPLKSA